MYNYDQVKKLHGNRVSQTIDSPIMIFDYFDLADAFTAIGIIVVFGLILYSWGTMLFFLILALGFAPVIKRKYNKGIFFHWPYKHLGFKLPGLIQPRGKRKFSD